MARFPLFFVFAFLAIVGLIGLALLPLKPKPFLAVEVRDDQGTLIIDGAALSQIRPAPGFAVVPPPGPRGDQIGPRLASANSLAPGAKYSKGARLLLGPKTIAALEGKAFSVIVEARSVTKTGAVRTSFGLVNDGPIEWLEKAISPTFAPLRFEIAAQDNPFTGFAFWPAVEGQGHGIEIKSIAIQPVPSIPLTSAQGTP